MLDNGLSIDRFQSYLLLLIQYPALAGDGVYYRLLKAVLGIYYRKSINSLNVVSGVQCLY